MISASQFVSGQEVKEMGEEVEEKKAKARGNIDRSDQKEGVEKSPLLTSTRKVLQKGREELELINVLMTERPKIRPFRTAFRRRIDEICGPRKAEKGMDQR
jgi:hypothetical protein